MSLITFIPKQSVSKRHVNILYAIIMFIYNCINIPIHHNRLSPCLKDFRFPTYRCVLAVNSLRGDNEHPSPLTSSTTSPMFIRGIGDYSRRLVVFTTYRYRNHTNLSALRGFKCFLKVCVTASTTYLSLMTSREAHAGH